MEELHTPELPGIDGVAAFLGVEPSTLLKCIAFHCDGKLGLALRRATSGPTTRARRSWSPILRCAPTRDG
jgi:hypothetical protein